MHNINGMKLLKDGYCMFILDGRHCCHSVEMLRDKEGINWAAESSPMRNAFRFGGKRIFPAQVIVVSMIACI